MFKTAKFVLAALGISAANALEYAMVHEYIEDDDCKANFISKHKPACVTADGKCHAPGTEGVECREVETWQWWHEDEPYMQYAPGVLPPPHRRQTHKGHAKQKTVWAYASSVTQGLAAQMFEKSLVTVESTLNTPVNQVAMIANIQINQPASWFNPGQNDTNGCGQKQTWMLPYGFDGNDPQAAVPRFVQNLTRLKQEGITITLTLASWCTFFPVKEWTVSEFQEFVNYFKELRQETFGGQLDGIDFDWEGYCNEVCLLEACSCDWDDELCGSHTPDELVQGVFWYVDDTSPDPKGPPFRFMCWMMPNKATLQVLGGITYYMKKAGFVATVVPMSTEAYTGEPDNSPKQNLKNEYIKWRKNTYEGQEFDLMEGTDGMLLQWYSGFDGSLCSLVDDPHACTCDNIELDDYPNWYNNTKDPEVAGLMYSWMIVDGAGSNVFPSKWPVRCQSCGPDVILPNGTIGDLACYPDGEDYMLPGDRQKHPQLVTSDQEGFRNYTTSMGTPGRPGLPYWTYTNFTYKLGRCPRAVDCPDWRYKNEEPYSRAIKMIESLGKVIDIEKISIGFETLATDKMFQMQSYVDPLLVWGMTTAEDHEHGHYFEDCSQNMTRDNMPQGKRCGAPVISSQWGMKMNASEIIGFEAAVRQRTGKDTAGIGVFTIDGFLWEKDAKDARLWYKPLCDLNKNYRIQCQGECCQNSHWEGLPTPDHLIEKSINVNPFIL